MLPLSIVVECGSFAKGRQKILNPATPDPQNRRDVFDTLNKQLERMRGMHYGYYSQFFHAIHIFTVLFIAIIALSLLPQLAALILVLPFLVIYAGAFCSYLITYNLFARVYATALEKRINAVLGEEILVAHKMEDVFIYRTASPKFVGVDLTTPSTAISFITVNYIITGLVLLAIGAYRAAQLLPSLTPKFALLSIYWPLLIVFGAGNLAYLLWYFLSASHEKRIKKIVNEAYGIE